MSVLENFKNIPRSPYGGATVLKCNFFSSNFQRSPWGKKKRGACRPPPHGRPGQAAYIRPPPHSLLSFDLKKSKKIKGSGEALPNSALVIYR